MDAARVAPETSRTTPPPGPSTSSVTGNAAHATIALGRGCRESANALPSRASSFSRRFRSFARNFSASFRVLCVYTFGSSPPAAGARCVSCTNARVVSVTEAAGSSKMAVAGTAPLEPPTSPSRQRNATFSVNRRRYPCGAASAFSVGPRSTRHTVPRMASSGPASKAAEDSVRENFTVAPGPERSRWSPVPRGEYGVDETGGASGSGAAKDASNTRIRGTSPTLTASPRSSSSAVVCSFSGENAAWVERPSSSFTGASSSSAKDRSSNSFEGCSSTTRSGTSASSSRPPSRAARKPARAAAGAPPGIRKGASSARSGSDTRRGASSAIERSTRRGVAHLVSRRGSRKARKAKRVKRACACCGRDLGRSAPP